MIDADRITLGENASIREALQIIDRGGKRIALVVSPSNELLGTITDGDIRRALLDGKRLDESIGSVFNPSPLTCRLNEPKSNLLRKAADKKIYILPIVDPANRLIGIEDINDYLKPESFENLVILMAGGVGNRLKPLTDKVPKPMLRVGNKLILETIIENFTQYGFKNFAISVDYKSKIIRDYFGSGEKYGINIRYLEEKKKMGTAGALGMLGKLPELPFFVMNGDILTNINIEHLLEFHTLNKADATVAVTEISFEIPYGVIDMEEKNILDIREKPSHVFYVNAGIYVLQPSVLQFLNLSEYLDMPQLLKLLIEKGNKVISFPIHEYWLDIGKMDDYKKAQADFSALFNGKKR